MSQQTASDGASGGPDEHVSLERLAQWRSTVDAFFADAWAELRSVTEALEAQAHAAEVPFAADTAASATELARPHGLESLLAADAREAAPSSFPPEALGGQDRRLAELAQKLQERLQRSERAGSLPDSSAGNSQR